MPGTPFHFEPEALVRPPIQPGRAASCSRGTLPGLRRQDGMFGLARRSCSGNGMHVIGP